MQVRTVAALGDNGQRKETQFLFLALTMPNLPSAGGSVTIRTGPMSSIGESEGCDPTPVLGKGEAIRL